MSMNVKPPTRVGVHVWGVRVQLSAPLPPTRLQGALSRSQWDSPSTTCYSSGQKGT